jgi:hypothetical protein
MKNVLLILLVFSTLNSFAQEGDGSSGENDLAKEFTNLMKQYNLLEDKSSDKKDEYGEFLISLNNFKKEYQEKCSNDSEVCKNIISKANTDLAFEDFLKSSNSISSIEVEVSIAYIRKSLEKNSGNYNPQADPMGFIQCADSKKPFSLDFPACSEYSDFFMMAMGSEQVINLAQQTHTTIQQGKIQENVAEKSASGDIHGAAIQGIRDNANMRRDQETTKAAVYGTKATMIGVYLKKWPTHKNFEKKCEDSRLEEKLGTGICKKIEESDFYTNHIDQIYSNNQVRGLAWQELTKATGQLATSSFLASQFDKQGNMADDYNKKLEALKAEDDPVYQVADCEQFPDAAHCVDGNGDRRAGERIEFNNFVGNPTGANDYAFSKPETIGEFEGNDNVDPNALSELGNVLVRRKAGPDNSFNAPGAATLAQGAGGGGAGGGGAPGGRASAPGGGGGNNQLAGAQTNSGARGSGKSFAYGKASGGIGYGASGKKVSKDKKKGNSFAGLFGGNKKARQVASEIDNSNIMPKDIKLFEKISKRYQWAHKQQRIDLKK